MVFGPSSVLHQQDAEFPSLSYYSVHLGLVLVVRNELATCSLLFLVPFLLVLLRRVQAISWRFRRVRQRVRLGLFRVSRIESGRRLFGFLILHDEQLKFSRCRFLSFCLRSDVHLFGFLFRLRHFCLFGFYLLLLLLFLFLL